MRTTKKAWSLDSNGNPKLSGDNSSKDIVNRFLDDMQGTSNGTLPD